MCPRIQMMSQVTAQHPPTHPMMMTMSIHAGMTKRTPQEGCKEELYSYRGGDDSDSDTMGSISESERRRNKRPKEGKENSIRTLLALTKETQVQAETRSRLMERSMSRAQIEWHIGHQHNRTRPIDQEGG
jgi:hypothetical protein